MKKVPNQILGIDPGVANMGISLVQGTESPDFMDLKMTYQRHFGPDDLPPQAATHEELLVFGSRFRDLLTELEIDGDSHVICERFEFRGKFTGHTIELVNLMIGIISATCPCPCRLIRPTDWKSFRKRRPDVLCALGETDHEQDATNMALYQWWQLHHRGKKR